jgi:hypothetical protein
MMMIMMIKIKIIIIIIIINTDTDSKGRLCQQFGETMDHTISARKICKAV